MKRIEQTLLAYRAGSTEKVYEIDLCEVGPNRFVVNYRYGRRGSVLKDGTRTVAPVPEEDARRIYAKLVASKTKAGYTPSEAHLPAPAPPEPVAPPPAIASPPTPAPVRPVTVPVGSDPVRQGVLKRLAAGEAGPAPSTPTTPRPSMMDRMRHLAFRRPASRSRGPVDKRWTLNRAIWRAGELRLKEAVPLLVPWVGSEGAVRDHCLAFALGRSGDSAAIPALQRLSQHKAPHVARMATAALLDLLDPAGKAALQDTVLETHEGLAWSYLVGDRDSVLREIATLPLVPPHFRELRAIFKLAEYRSDAQVFGLMAYRFALTPAMFDNSTGSASVPDRSGTRRTHMWEQQLQSMLASPNATAAYGSKTRWYLQQRVWRTLKRLGKDKDAAFVPMAVGVLAPFSDADGRGSGGWHGPFASYFAFNQVMFSAGSRLRCSKRAFVGRQQDATTREEPYRALWDAQPRALLHLISESACTPVHGFAARILRDNPAFCASLPVPVLVMMLGRPFRPTLDLAFEQAQRRFVPGGDPAALTPLVFAVATCGHEAYRAEAHRWMESSAAWFVNQPQGLSWMILSDHSDVRRFVRRFLDANTLSDADGVSVVNTVLAAMTDFGPEDELRARDIADTLRLTLAAALSKAAASSVLALLGSEVDAVRLLGVHLLQSLDDASLLADESRLWDLLTHRDPAMRNAVEPTVAGLASRHGAYGGKLLQMMLASVLRRLLPEGVPGFLIRFIRKHMENQLASIPEAVVWRLVRSKESAAQELGGLLLPNHLDPDTVDIPQLVELGSHEILSLREAAWQAYERMVPRLKADMPTAVTLLEATWEDTRLFAFRFFEAHFDASDFDPTLLVTICDSVKPDVQAYGRRLINTHFDEAHGEQYLLQLSEHPASDVQLFATNYLHRYASGNIENLEKLEDYFVRILCAVNRGRVAKQRTHAFLREEALRDAASATLVGRILGRQSASDAVEEREAALVTMTAIHRAFPEVELPITFEPVEVRA